MKALKARFTKLPFLNPEGALPRRKRITRNPTFPSIGSHSPQNRYRTIWISDTHFRHPGLQGRISVGFSAPQRLRYALFSRRYRRTVGRLNGNGIGSKAIMMSSKKS